MMLGSVFFLEGDSFGGRSRVETLLRRRLMFRHWTSQGEMIARSGDGKPSTDIPTRLAVLERVVLASPEAGPKVVIGRSSGARVASLFAASGRAASAVVCFAYPFRHPKRPPEPERYAHLAGISTPTLIVQGRSDAYGGEEVTGKYPLSDAVTIRFVDCGHDFRLSGEARDEVADLVADFCDRHAGETEFRGAAASDIPESAGNCYGAGLG
jgi:predicted alpha/beta-hydrolase family hydrolase